MSIHQYMGKSHGVDQQVVGCCLIINTELMRAGTITLEQFYAAYDEMLQTKRPPGRRPPRVTPLPRLPYGFSDRPDIEANLEAYTAADGTARIRYVFPEPLTDRLDSTP
jgi:hypothetical protein